MAKFQANIIPMGSLPLGRRLLSLLPSPSITRRTIMLSNLLPAVAEAVWPDHIEIELRIEIQR